MGSGFSAGQQNSRSATPGAKPVVGGRRKNSQLALWLQEVLTLVSGGRVSEEETSRSTPARLAPEHLDGDPAALQCSDADLGVHS